jgi:hypothetical protein
MNKWIKVDADLFRKPKFLHLTQLSGMSRLETAGSLVAIWSWVQYYGTHTELPGHLVEQATGVPAGFIDALCKVQWAVQPNDKAWTKFMFVGTTDPEIKEMKSQAGRKGAAQRWQANGTPMAEACQIKTKTKTKTENKTQSEESPNGDSSFRLAGESPGPGSRKAARIGWDQQSGFTGIDDALRSAWSAAAPLADVAGELAKAHAWLSGQPAAKRKRDYRRFLTNWFLRTQERMASRGGPDGPVRRTVPFGCTMDADGTIRTPSGARLGGDA